MLCGCAAVNVNQLGTVRRLLPERGAKVDEVSPPAWSLRIAGGEYTVYLLPSESDKMVFGSPHGFRVLWDGQSVYRVEFLPGAIGLLQSGVEGEERWYARDGGPTIRLACGKTSLRELSDTRQSDWEVKCTGSVDGRRITAVHAALFDAAGRLRRIEATVLPGVAPLVLERR